MNRMKIYRRVCQVCNEAQYLIQPPRSERCRKCFKKTQFTGGWVDSQGYPRRFLDGRKQRLHRVIMSKHCGRELTSKEVVHHIDGDRSNNNLDNLMLFSSQAEHARHHKILEKKESK